MTKQSENADKTLQESDTNAGTAGQDVTPVKQGKPSRDALGRWKKGQTGNPEGGRAGKRDPEEVEFVLVSKALNRVIQYIERQGDDFLDRVRDRTPDKLLDFSRRLYSLKKTHAPPMEYPVIRIETVHPIPGLQEANRAVEALRDDVQRLTNALAERDRQIARLEAKKGSGEVLAARDAEIARLKKFIEDRLGGEPFVPSDKVHILDDPDAWENWP